MSKQVKLQVIIRTMNNLTMIIPLNPLFARIYKVPYTPI